MVYTVTFNPAVDYIVHTKQLIAGATNRSDSEEIYFGGKGINVSIVLSELGVKSKALGFVAGFTGEAIENGVAEKGIDADFVHLNEGFSRINVKIKSSEETELNGQGPKITDEAIRELYAKLDEIQDGDTLVLAGSIPSSLPADIYERILERLSGKKIRAVVDATKDLLLNVLKYRPFLIKPNNFELGEIFGVEMKSAEDIVKYAGKVLVMNKSRLFCYDTVDRVFARTEELAKIGLDVPQVTRMSHILKSLGTDIGNDIYTTQRAAERLLPLIR